MADIYLHLDGQQAGPYQPAQVYQLLSENKITSETPAWHAELTEWSTVGKVLAQFPGAGPAGPPLYVPPAPQPLPPRPSPKQSGMHPALIAAIVIGAMVVLVLPCCAGIALGPITNGIHKAKESMAMQTARAIGIAMEQYAVDHNGAYPDGKTSTEVFQKLIDGKYVADPGIFYLEMAGKTRATSTHLTADNVCFDVTSGVTSASPDGMPVVFCTGYTVTYSGGASAMRDDPVATPFPGPGTSFAGLAVAYKSGAARFMTAEENGTVANFMVSSFDSGGVTYQQLRP